MIVKTARVVEFMLSSTYTVFKKMFVMLVIMALIVVALCTSTVAILTHMYS